MENLLINITPILILLLLAVTFLQSGIDKITDWNGNITWLKEHFAKTYIISKINLPILTFNLTFFIKVRLLNC